jgi:hypothetical protein
VLKILKYIKTGYVAANYSSALFRYDKDGRAASDGGLLCWGSSQYFKSTRRV